MGVEGATDRCNISLFDLKLQAGVMSVAVALGVVLLLPGVLFLVAESQWPVPLAPRLIVFAINTVLAGALILFGLRNIRRLRRLMARARAEDIRFQWSGDGLMFTSRSGSHSYSWTDIDAIRTDRDYLSISPLSTRSTTALLLFADGAPRRPGLKLRSALAKAIRREPLLPTQVGRITVIPLTVFDAAGIRRLTAQAGAMLRPTRATTAVRS